MEPIDWRRELAEVLWVVLGLGLVGIAFWLRWWSVPVILVVFSAGATFIDWLKGS